MPENKPAANAPAAPAANASTPQGGAGAEQTSPLQAAANALAEAKAEVSAPAIGKVVRIRAVHGDLYHSEAPFTKFTTEDEKKVEVDLFIQIQIAAGKLAVAD